MYKKSLIVLFVFFAVLFVSSFSFANVNDVKNTVNNGTDAVIDGVDRLGSSVRNGIGNAENSISDALTMDNNMANTNTNNNNMQTAQSSIATGNGYDVTRTATAGTTDTTNIWVWIALAVAAVVIVGVVWYYVSDNNNR